MTSSLRLLGAFVLLTWLQVAIVGASDQQIVYIRNTCECWSTDLKCVCKIESDPTSVRPLMQRLVNRTAEYYWQEVEFQSMVYDRTTFILANTFADGPFPSGITFKGDFSIVNDSFNHLNMTLNKVELNFETFSGRKPKFSKQYWRYIFDHGEGTLRTLRIIKYQIEDFIIPNYLGAALTQEVRPLTEFKVVGCEVKEVKERAFKNFTQLEVLDLSDNHLTTLPENVFSRNINLQKILLANNQISFLTKTIFDGLPNLLLINLRKNKLTAVPAIPRHTNRRFQPMVYLMADNSIHCRCSLIWVLHELTFHHNLEIEATCSDPTMVRGMPIIEGFTRMDKEACYRIRNIDDDDQPEPLQLAGPTAAPVAVAAKLAPEALAVGAKNNQIAQTVAESAAAAVSLDAPLSPKKSSALDELVKVRAEEESKVAEAQSAAAATTAATTAVALSATTNHQMVAAAPVHYQREGSLSSLLAARSQLEQQQQQQQQQQTLTHINQQQVALGAAVPAPVANQVEIQSQAVAPQAPVSGPDAVLAQSGPSAARQPLSSAAAQLAAVPVAQQTVLTPPAQSVAQSVVAVAPPPPAHQSVGPHQDQLGLPSEQQSVAAPAVRGSSDLRESQ